MELKRPEKFGADLTFESYDEIESAYSGGEIHPADLKNMTADYMAEVLADVRSFLE